MPKRAMTASCSSGRMVLRCDAGIGSVHWNAVVAKLGLEDLHFHDLRHTGNTLAAATGAPTRELMTRMDHSSSRAALIYQHASQDREMAIGRALSQRSRPPANRPGERARRLSILLRTVPILGRSMTRGVPAAGALTNPCATTLVGDQPVAVHRRLDFGGLSQIALGDHLRLPADPGTVRSAV